jgi:hypothetical protein
MSDCSFQEGAITQKKKPISGFHRMAPLRANLYGYTPTAVPQVTTIRTGALVKFIGQAHPIIIATGRWRPVQSLPGAVILPDSGTGEQFSDAIQYRLSRKMVELTGGDMVRPIVAVEVNSERFDGLNLALRLVALGYTIRCASRIAASHEVPRRPRQHPGRRTWRQG